VAEPSDWPAGEHVIIFATGTRDDLRGSVVRVADDGIVSIEFGCGATHPAVMAGPLAGQLLAAPTGGLALVGEGVAAEAVELPPFVVQETSPTWRAVIGLVDPVGGYRTVLIDAETVLADGTGGAMSPDAISRGTPLSIVGVPLPWSLWRAERIDVVDGPEVPDVRESRRFESSDFGVAFEYQTAPDGFAMSEIRDPEPGLAVAWHLARERVIAASRDDAFGPRGITVEVFVTEGGVDSAEAWVQQSARSNFALGPRVIDARSVSGLPGVRYEWSGLYYAISVVAVRDREVWMFTATYRDDSAEIEGAFDEFLASVQLD
jgi:hypothetical protein